MNDHETFLVSGPPTEWKFWCGERTGDTTRVTSGRFGKGGARSTVKQHRDEAKARAFVATAAEKQRKKGFAPVSSDEGGPTVPVPVVPRGAHAHEGARALVDRVDGKRLKCALCGDAVDAVEISAHRLPVALLPTLLFPTHGDAKRGLRDIDKLATTLADLPVGTVWQSRSLFGAKPKPVKKLGPLSATDQPVAAMLQRLLERTAAGEPLLTVLEDLLLRSGGADAAVAASLLYGLDGGLRPVEVFNPAVTPTATLAWRLQQRIDAQRRFLVDVSERLALARLLLRASAAHPDDALDALGSAFYVTWVWDWLTEEEHDAARELAVRSARYVVSLEESGAPANDVGVSFATAAGCRDVAAWWALWEGAFTRRRRWKLLRALVRSPWPEGPASLVAWLHAHDYQTAGRKDVLQALGETGHPDKAAYAIAHADTPDAQPWLPYEVLSNQEEWPSYRARNPWPLRARVAAGKATIQQLSELAAQVWSAGGPHVPRRDAMGSADDEAQIEAWRQALLAASADLTITPIEIDPSRVPDASDHRRAVEAEREEHAELHRRARTALERFAGSRLGAAWSAALEPGPAGLRHRSAIFSRAVLDALEPDPDACTARCTLDAKKRNISLRLAVAVRFTRASEDAEHGIDERGRVARRADWRSFPRSVHRSLEVPLRFLVWDVESYLDEVEPSVSAVGAERLIQLLAAWDHSLSRTLQLDAELTIPRLARHLSGDPSVSSETFFDSGIVGFGLLRDIPVAEVEMLVRSLLAPPLYDDREGLVADALLGADGVDELRAAPHAPFPKIFADATARDAWVAPLEVSAKKGEVAEPPSGEPREITFATEEARVVFRFLGSRSTDRYHALLEHTETSWSSDLQSEATASGVIFRATLDLDSVLDHLLDMSDSSSDGALDATLRSAVEEALGAAEETVIEVR